MRARSISSNLNCFREGFARQIVTSGLDTLPVALDGASQQTYEQYRRGGDFELAVGNVREIAAEKQAARCLDSCTVPSHSAVAGSTVPA